MIKVIVIARENECAGGVASVESRRVKKQNKISATKAANSWQPQ